MLFTTIDSSVLLFFYLLEHLLPQSLPSHPLCSMLVVMGLRYAIAHNDKPEDKGADPTFQRPCSK